jgi:hypothetical protein
VINAAKAWERAGSDDNFEAEQLLDALERLSLAEEGEEDDAA